ncbi:hypothetical protein OHR68_33385 [Spirillospora sp. NBC_00431]
MAGASGVVDAVVVVPGIMGSELVDTTSGDLIWRVRNPGWYTSAWTSGRALRDLAITEDELAGRSTRVKATGLLRFPAFAPILSGIEPYSQLCARLRQVVAHPSAVLEFAYDWRLPVTVNGACLTDAALVHLERWRNHEAVRGAGDEPKLVLVAHSMGGLLCRAATATPGFAEHIRATITLGTPFDGAAKAAVILNSGRGAPVPLPRRRLRALAATLPGIHDLLPVYRSVEDGDHLRRLTPGDVERLGGDRELAAAAFEMHGRGTSTRLVGHRALIGVDQPTVHGMRLRAGVVVPYRHTYPLDAQGEPVRDGEGALVRTPGAGDGTVPRNSALPVGTAPVPLPQQHGSIAKTAEAIAFVSDCLRHGRSDIGPRLSGLGGIGADVPDIVTAGVATPAALTGAAPAAVTCVVRDAGTGAVVDHPPAVARNGRTQVSLTLPAPGLYRVEFHGGGSSPVTQLALAVSPDEGTGSGRV